MLAAACIGQNGRTEVVGQQAYGPLAGRVVADGSAVGMGTGAAGGWANGSAVTDGVDSSGPTIAIVNRARLARARGPRP